MPPTDFTSMLSLFPFTASVLANGRLAIAGRALDALADQYSTPLYLFDAQTVRVQVDRLHALLAQRYPGPSAVAYAAKAYFSAGFARRLAQMGVELDVVSLGELRAARRAGFPAEALHQHGSNKSAEELRAALEWGIHAIVVDSLDELAFLEVLAQASGRAARIWLRVTPDLDVRTHAHIATGSADSKFGLHLENGQAAEAIRRARASRWLEPVGLHFHLGSQLSDAAPYRTAIGLLFDLAAQTGLELEEFSPGGGWGVRYTPADPPDDPAPWIDAVCGAVTEACAHRGWKLPRLVIEPGRWLVARAGVAVYTVGMQKETAAGEWIVAVDGGMADNPRPALYGSRYTACLASAPLAPGTRPARLAGRFCESGDVLIPEVDLPPVQRGDRLVMPAAGAYQLALASNYNLAPRPAVLWLEAGGETVLQVREQIDGIGWWGG
jgi:diaminopimelate decarboxylase